VPESITDLAGLKADAEGLLAAVLEAAAQPIWVVGPDGLIRFANRAAIAALGYERADELVGRDSHDVLHRHPDGTPHPAADCPMLLPRATGETVSSDLDWFVRRDGSMLPVSYVSAPSELPGGRGAVVAFADIEDRVRAERARHEQAALRRVATLVARGVPPPEVFAAVAREVGLLLAVDATHMGRYELDGTATGVAAWSPAGDQIAIGTRLDLEGESVAGLVLRTGRPARMHGYENARGAGAALGRELGLRASVGAPIVVDQRLWGVMIASSKGDGELPVDAESRIAAFTELVATAISNTEAREEVGRLADEQAGLRRAATLAARDVPSRELFGAVAEEVGRVLRADVAGMVRYETDEAVVVAAWAGAGEPPEIGGRWPLDAAGLATTIWKTGQPARMEDYDGIPGRLAAIREGLGVRSSVGSPIVVEGRLWGALFVHSTQAEPLAADTEARLLNFTELVATAMSKAHARAEVQRLADEQAALRRVATLVARQSSPGEVFAVVAEEVGRLLPMEATALLRFEPDGTATLVANWGEPDVGLPVGTRLTLEDVEGDVVALVLQKRRAARVDDFAKAPGSAAAYARMLGVRSAVATPIVVEERLWGAMCAFSRRVEPLPTDAEARIGEFTELLATAIANIQARSELAASRARIVAAADDERCRVVRDLHDGAQQRLVHTIITLKMACAELEREQQAAPALVREALHNAERANVELRELAHGILPADLTHGGLRAAVAELASRTPVPVEIDVSVGRLPAAVEATAYFVVAEALTNIAKHARAKHAEVTARLEDGTLAVQVRDDGVGGARTDGSGLVGLADRLAALDGRLRIESPADGGTLVAAVIRLPA
jgi:PAS domain S-box-containing protein